VTRFSGLIAHGPVKKLSPNDQHVDKCMWHASEDIVKSILAQLARTLIEWHCNSFADLIDEMELWD